MANLMMATTHEPTAAPAIFRFVNSFARELQGFYVPQRPAIVFEPRLLFLNDSLAEELDLDLTSFNATARAAIFAGNTLPEGAEPLAQAYAGHKFGGFSPQLGDGAEVGLSVDGCHGDHRQWGVRLLVSPNCAG